MYTGIVKCFDAVKGYGFISGEQEKGVFVHHSNILMNGFRKLEEGQHVTFDLSENSKGKCAINVQVIEA